MDTISPLGGELVKAGFLGKGGQGEVVEVYSASDPSQRYALKVSNISLVSSQLLTLRVYHSNSLFLLCWRVSKPSQR